MAYTPTLQDFDDAVGQSNTQTPYTPTLQDFDDAVNEQQPQHGFLMNTLLGAGGAVRDFAQDVADVLPNTFPNVFPRGEFPQVSHGDPDSWGGTIGRGGTNLGIFMAGGEALDTLRGVSEGLPLIGRLASGLAPLDANAPLTQQIASNMARQGIGSGTYGMVTNPNDPTGGGISGTLFGSLLGAVPYAPQAVKNVGVYFNPDIAAQKLLEGLGGGQSLADNAKSLAGDIQNSYNQQAAPLKKGFEDIRQVVGEQPIYKGGLNDSSVDDNSGVAGGGLFRESNYLNGFDEFKPFLTPDLNKLHKQFLSNPTYNNARSLFSQYATETARLSGKAPGDLDSAENNQLQAFSHLKGSIDSDIQSFLGSKSQDLVDQYNNLKRGWLQNVIPYQASDISRVLGKNPDIPVTIHKLFGTPSHLPDTSDMKVFNDLPPQAQGKLLYSALGKMSSSKNPQTLVNNADKLTEQGLGDFATPEFKTQIENLKNIIARKNSLNTIIGGAAGFGLGHLMPLAPELTTTVGALAGGVIGNQVIPALSRAPLTQALVKGLSTTGKYSYPWAQRIALSNLLPGASN